MPADARPHPAAIVVENLAPLVGVLFFGWSVAPVMVVYWIENGLRGLETAARIVLASGDGDGDSPNGPSPDDPAGQPVGGGNPPSPVRVPDLGALLRGRVGLAGRLGLTAFFLVHYGIFWAVHGAFVFIMFVGAGGVPIFGDRAAGAGLPKAEIALAAVLIATTMLIALIRDLARPGRRAIGSAVGSIGRAYTRVIILHIAILAGGFAVVLLGSPTPALVMLIALKTAADLGAWRWRGRPDGRPVDP